MCGIAGIVDIGHRRMIDEEVVRSMTEALHHRGPDGDGYHFEPGVAFGHRRLSIIDIEGGKQPIYNEDNSIVLTYNGEIYNYQELADELIARGHTFRTHCDTEVVVHAWEEWGSACLDRFNGMFAFALWDRNRQSVFLARDRVGIKPLYYAMLGDGFLLFASELKAITKYPQLTRDVDFCAIEDYLTFGYVPEPKTIFRSVKKLEPGTFLCIERGKIPPEPVRYWDVPLDQPPDLRNSLEEIGPQLLENLKASVNRRLIADVPLGAFLSGGIDSSAVVAMMRELGKGSILTCSIGFLEQGYDESEYADLVAEAKKTDHKKELVDYDDFSLLDRLVGIYDEPYADSSAIPTYRVCELARKYVTVALSGDGGDENYIGYDRYALFSMEECLRSVFSPGIRKSVFGALGRYYPKLDWAPRVFRGKTTFQALARDSVDAYLHGVSIVPEDTRKSLFSKEFLSHLDGYNSRQVFADHISGKTFSDPLRMVQYLDFKTYLAGDILTKVDRASMANSLEVRVPFLDHEFISWTARIPTKLKLKFGSGKKVLKESLRPVLPEDVLFRKKMGFAVPLDRWFRDALKNRMTDVVTGNRLKSSGIFNPQSLEKLAADHKSGRRNHSAILWALLMLDGFLNAAAENAP